MRTTSKKVWPSDPQQVAFRTNWSTEVTIPTALLSVFTHTHWTTPPSECCLWILAQHTINTISPMKLIGNFTLLASLPHSATGYLPQESSIVRYTDDTKEILECTENNLQLNISKTKELLLFFFFRKEARTVYINGAEMEQVNSFKFPGINIRDFLISFTNEVKKASDCKCHKLTWDAQNRKALQHVIKTSKNIFGT